MLLRETFAPARWRGFLAAPRVGITSSDSKNLTDK